MNGIVYDNGTSNHISNCFPVRSCSNFGTNEGGAWVLECNEIRDARINTAASRPLTYESIKKERKRSDKTHTKMKLNALRASQGNLEDLEENQGQGQLLDGFFLMKKFCVDDPSDLCSINISCESLCDVTAPDLCMFDNIAYVNAAENRLNIDHFASFQTLRELELPLNDIRRLQVQADSLPNLEMLDLSYNNIEFETLTNIGSLRRLKVLHLTGNNLVELPQSLAGPVAIGDVQGDGLLFQNLEILLLDDNLFDNVDVFASLAALKNLKHLNLSKNQIFAVPQLMLVRGIHVPCTSVPPPPVTESAPEEEVKIELTVGESDRQLDVVTPNDDLERDLTFTQLDLDKLDEKIEEEQVKEKMKEEELSENSGETPTRMPFSELRYLDISHNLVTNEQNLLAVSTWPVLSELILYDNPVLSRKSRLPHMLKFFLSEQLGIRIQRKPSKTLLKPHIEISNKEERKVRSYIKSVPRCNVDELLSLESNNDKQKSIENTQEHVTTSTLSISSNVRRTATDSIADHLTAITEQSPRDVATEDEEEERETGAGKSEGHRDFNARKADGTSEDREGEYANAFFMTEPNAKSGERFYIPFRVRVEDDVENYDEKENANSSRIDGKKKTDEKYRGYEVLLDIDESLLDNDIPKDLHGNVRALHYMLEHPLLYGENRVDLLSSKHEFKRRSKIVLKPIRHTRKDKETADRLASLLINMRERSCVVEAPLKSVLDVEKTEFTEARHLLSRVQNKYNSVRENSRKTSANKLTDEIQKQCTELTDNA